jgi:hypothetical protein
MNANRTKLLTTINDLRLADLELLRSVCRGEKFGIHGVRYAADDLLKKGYLYRLWKHRDPKFRMDRGSARQVFLLTEKAGEQLALSKDECQRLEKWFRYLSDPRREYVLEHELMIARFHAALMKGRLTRWEQGPGTQLQGHGFRITPDAYFTYEGRHYFLEADTGNERIRSDDPKRRTIERKIRKYGLADREGVENYQLPEFGVVFMTPRRSNPNLISGREQSILHSFKSSGHLNDHADWFYSLISETHILQTLEGQALPPFRTYDTLTESDSDSPSSN